MGLDEIGPAPYAPSRTIELVIDQHRNQGIPTPIDIRRLARIGIEESLARRTLRSLRILDLVTDEGEPTDTFEKIRVAPTDQLAEVLADWFREVYKPILTYIEPSDDLQKINDQFRHYEPAGQRNRMVTLFLGLAAKAGLIEAVPPIPRGTTKTVAKPKTPKTKKPNPPDTQGREPPSADADPLDVVRQRYVALLIAKAESQDSLDTELLDRIERALGIAGGAS